MTPEFIAQALAFIGPHEGDEPHIYLDTVRRCTVGVGNMLPTAQSAADLPFVLRATGQPATGAQKARDWQLVAGAAPGRLASWYAHLTDCILTPDAVSSLFAARTAEFVGQLERHFPAFASWPDPAQIAVLDWVYNCGVGALLGTVHFKAALFAQNWPGCAASCGRATNTPEGQLRNDQTKGLFESC